MQMTAFAVAVDYVRAILAVDNVGVRSAVRKVFMLRGVIAAVVLLVSVGAGAAMPPNRVVVLDAVGLTPKLEQSNARERLEEAVTATVKEHGWEPVASATECHDFTCVGSAAADAKVRYALILVGRFVPNEYYATDVGVSLWRDGSVVSRRTESDEQAEFDKVGVGAFLSCGPPSGACTAPLITSKLQQYAATLLDQETIAIRDRAAVDAAAAPKHAVWVDSVPEGAVSPAPGPLDSGGGRIIGWSLVGAGVLLGGGGAGLWAYDGSAVDCHSVADSGCRQTRHTLTAAALVGAAGLVAAAAGVVILVVDRGQTRVALSVYPSGLVVGGLF